MSVALITNAYANNNQQGKTLKDFVESSNQESQNKRLCEKNEKALSLLQTKVLIAGLATDLLIDTETTNNKKTTLSKIITSSNLSLAASAFIVAGSSINDYHTMHTLKPGDFVQAGHDPHSGTRINEYNIRDFKEKGDKAGLLGLQISAVGSALLYIEKDLLLSTIKDSNFDAIFNKELGKELKVISYLLDLSKYEEQSLLIKTKEKLADQISKGNVVNQVNIISILKENKIGDEKLVESMESIFKLLAEDTAKNAPKTLCSQDDLKKSLARLKNDLEAVRKTNALSPKLNEFLSKIDKNISIVDTLTK